MATVIEPRPLADLEQDAIARLEAEWERRARGVKPWTTQEYLDKNAQIHAHYEQRRTWLRRHEQVAA